MQMRCVVATWTSGGATRGLIFPLPKQSHPAHSLSDSRPPAFLSRKTHSSLRSCPHLSHRPLTSEQDLPPQIGFSSLRTPAGFTGPGSHLDSSLPLQPLWKPSNPRIPSIPPSKNPSSPSPSHTAITLSTLQGPLSNHVQPFAPQHSLV